jgi:uncharacterized membrane protein
MNETTVDQTASGENAKIIYILYIVGVLVPVTAIVGVIMAYVHKDTAPDWLKTHYHFQIRTFWISLLYWFVSVLLCFIFIGFVLLVVALVWWIIRCVKGLQTLEKRAPIADVNGWGF